MSVLDNITRSKDYIGQGPLQSRKSIVEHQIRSILVALLSIAIAIGIGVTVSLFSTVNILYFAVSLFVGVILMFFYRTEVSLSIIIVWIAIQNTVIPILYYIIHSTSNSIWTILLSTSQATVLSIVILYLLKQMMIGRRPSVWSLVIIFLSVSVLASAIIHRDSSLFTAINSARGLLVPVLYVWLGRTVGMTGISQRRIIKVMAYVTFVGAILAILDALVVPTSLWTSIDISKYWLEVKHVPASEVGVLPGNFFENYGGSILRRAVSIYGDPLAAGYSMAFGFAATLITMEYEIRKYWYVVMLIIIVAGIALTFTRAAYIIVVIEFLAFSLYRRSSGKPLSKLYFFAMLAIFIFIARKVLTSTLGGTNGSLMIHLHAIDAIPVLIKHPMGFGVGSLGGPEGAYLQIWWQYGIVVLGLFGLFLWVTYKRLLSVEVRLHRIMVMGVFWAIIVTGFISQEMQTDTASSIAWIIIGMGWCERSNLVEKRELMVMRDLKDQRYFLRS